MIPDRLERPRNFELYEVVTPRPHPIGARHRGSAAWVAPLPSSMRHRRFATRVRTSTALPVGRV